MSDLVRIVIFLGCCSLLSACLPDDDDKSGPPAELRDRVDRIERLSTVEPWTVSQEKIENLRREVDRVPVELRHRLTLIEARNLALAGDPAQSLNNLRRLLEEELSPRHALRARVLASNVAALVNEHETAFRHLLRGLQMLETVENPSARADVLGRASYLFGEVGEFERSRLYAARAVREAKETDDDRELCAELLQYANARHETPEWPADDILESLNQAEPPCVRAGDPIYIATIESIRGQIELATGNVPVAIARLEDVYSEMQAIDYTQGIEDVGLWLAKAHLRNGDIDQASQLLDWLPEALEERGRWRTASDAWHAKSRLHETQGGLALAHQYQERSGDAAIEARRNEQAIRTAYLQVDFQTRLNEFDARLLEERVRGDRFLRNSSMAGCVLLVSLVFLVYRRYRLSGRLSRIIEEQNAELIALGQLVRRINTHSSPSAILDTFLRGVTNVLDDCRRVEILRRDAGRAVHKSRFLNASDGKPDTRGDIPADELHDRYLNGARIDESQGLSRRAYLQDRTDPATGEHAVLMVFPFGDVEWTEAVLLITLDRSPEEIDSRLMNRVGRLVSHADTVISRARELEDVLTEQDRADAAISELRQTYLALKSAMALVDESSRRKDHFLSSTSHYLRTPLQSIVGHASRLDRELSPRVTFLQRQIANIRVSAEHLSALVGGLMDNEEIFSGGDRLVEEEALLYPVIDQVCEMLRPQADARQNRFDIRVDSRWLVNTDVLKLRQVVINLISNAIRFTRDGIVSIRATSMAGSGDRRRSWLCLEVRDDGVGIALEDQEYIFQPFRQFGDSGGGTGLGLAVTKSLCHRLGGDINVHSVPGQGAIFKVSLPILVDDTDNILESDASPARTSDSAPVSGTILVVEDDPVNRELVEEFLRSEGLSVKSVGTGQDALSCWQRLAPELVIMDMGLPDIQGDEVTRRIRERESGDARVPIIALSAFSDQKTRSRAMEAGCSLYVTKPVDFDALVEQIRTLID